MIESGGLQVIVTDIWRCKRNSMAKIAKDVWYNMSGRQEENTVRGTTISTAEFVLSSLLFEIE